MKTKAHHSAFPQHEVGRDFTNQDAMVIRGGLTKREYFAAMAMQAFIGQDTEFNEGARELVARQAVKFADAVLAELGNASSDGEPG